MEIFSTSGGYTKKWYTKNGIPIMGIPKNGIPQRYTKIIIGIPNYGYTKKKSQKLWLYGIPGITIIWLYCFTLVGTDNHLANRDNHPLHGCCEWLSRFALGGYRGWD